MKEWTLDLIIRQFDDYLKEVVDFEHLPERESEDYRKLVLQTANDVIFAEGRYNTVSEWTLEMFGLREVVQTVNDLNEINQLTDSQRIRLSYYKDLVAVCYPLFSGKLVDWTAWPWHLTDGRNSLLNQQLYDLICHNEYPRLAAALLYDLKQQIWMNQDERYSTVACAEASQCYEMHVAHLWDSRTKTDDYEKQLAAAVSKCVDDLWSIENHTMVGRLMGMDALEQGVYDSLDTYIDSTYRYNQVLCARELTIWIHQHWPMGERHPEPEIVEALLAKWREVMKRYDVVSPDERYSWNILTLDVLGMSMFSKEELQGHDDDDDDLWDDDDELWEDEDIDPESDEDIDPENK